MPCSEFPNEQDYPGVSFVSIMTLFYVLQAPELSWEDIPEALIIDC